MGSESPIVNAFNRRVADQLLAISMLLERQQANPFRVSAYRNAATIVVELEKDLREILKNSGHEGLTHLSGIGEGLAATIHGIGPRRLEAVRNALTTLMKTRRKRGADHLRARIKAPVAEILDVDAEYLKRAQRDDHVRIAPRRFNPDNVAWLPILHTDRLPRHYTALFSNTARANELKRTRDWVIVYFHDDQHREGQATVVTETHGKLQGRRVVRGREQECAEHYLSTQFGEVKMSLGID